MNTYELVTGERFHVLAASPAEAWEKAVAHFTGNDCPCGITGCKCMTYQEADTRLLGRVDD
jgi:hypothetical protein